MAKSDRILALDIGASTLKLAEFHKGRDARLQLSRYVVQPLGINPQDDDDRSRYIISTLREMIAENAIRTGPVVVSVSGQSVFSRYVPLPPVDPDKVAQIVQYEAQQNVPFPMEEVVWDYQLIGGADGKVDVMIAAIKGEIIEELTDCISFAGLAPDLVDVAPMTIYNCVRYNYGELDGCTLIVDMGARSTDLVFLEGNRVFSRSVPFAGNAITQQIMREFDMTFDEAEDLKKAHAFVSFGGAYAAPSSELADKVSKNVRAIMTRMHAEINRSISFYRTQQSGSSPQLVLLTGGTSVIPYTDSFMREKLKVEVDYLNPFLNVAVSEEIDAEEIGENAHQLSEVVGLALRRTLTCPIELNLMPPKVAAEKAFRRKQPVFVFAMIVALLTVALWCGYFVKMTSLARERAEKVDQRVRSLKAMEAAMMEPEAQIAASKQRLMEVSQLIHQRSQWLELMSKIHLVLRDGMWLSELKSLRPQAQPQQEFTGRNSRRSGRVPLVEKEVKPDAIERIRLSGFAYKDKLEGDNPIVELRNRLRALPGISTNQTEIVVDRQMDEFLREFQIEIKLEEPIPL